MRENKYKIIKILGEGSYGSVYLAEKKFSQNGPEFVAIKKFLMRDKKSYQSFKNELKILKNIKSDYLIKILDYYKDSSYMYMVMEYAPNGDLEQYIRSVFKNKKKVDFKFLDSIIYQVTEGLNILHKNRIIHRDIKTSNILIFDKNIVKIADFGVSKMLENNKLLANTSIGTPYYMSPEIINGKPYNYSVDFWALGCLIYNYLTNKYPFEASNITLLCKKIIKGEYDMSKIHEKYKSIIKKLLDRKNRGDENDVFKFILSNCNTFINKNKILGPIKKKSTISKEEIREKYSEKIKPYGLSKKLGPIDNNENKYYLKEINEINKKLEPINFKYKKKLEELDEIKLKKNKLEPIDKKYNWKKIEDKINNNIKLIDKKYDWRKIEDKINNIGFKNNKLEPIFRENKNNKKDFVKYNIQNIKNLQKKGKFR